MRVKECLSVVVLAILSQLLSPAHACSQSGIGTLGAGNWLTVSSNLDGGYRRTQFFLPHYNTALFQWDSRVELWLPPSHKRHRWGLYLRAAGIAGSERNAWQNGWLGSPGIGLQLYPLSSERFRHRGSVVGRLFGPLRMFAEYNFTHYWGEDFPRQGTSFRPHHQVRTGFEYWKAANVNALDHYWWTEVWNGLYWQSANEFTDRYDSVILANSVRLGVRKAHSGIISTITPYMAVDSSLSKWRRLGFSDCSFKPDPRNPLNPCDFYWENRLLAGAGVRFAPPLGTLDTAKKSWVSRFVIYGEYLRTATYYGPAAPSSFPRWDVRVGVSANVGNNNWYK